MRTPYLSNQLEKVLEKFEISRSGSGSNVRSMEGLRGFAVFLVFLVHYVSLSQSWIPAQSITSPIANSLHIIGNSGVDLFFILSGFLIYGSLIKKEQSYLVFLRRRIRRIYPAFTVVFVLYLVLSYTFPAESKIPSNPLDAAAYITLNYLLLPGIFPIEPIITVAWSLSYELFYYATMPAIIGLFKLRGISQKRRILFFALMVVAFSAFCIFTNGPIRLVMFISGVLLYETMRIPGRLPETLSRFGILGLLGGLLALLLPLNGVEGKVAKVLTLFFGYYFLCLACFKQPTAQLTRAFCWSPLRWLGNMSYSYYLLHGLTLKALFSGLPKIFSNAPPSEILFWSLVPIAFFITLIPAATLYLIVERPFSLIDGNAPNNKQTAPST